MFQTSSTILGAWNLGLVRLQFVSLHQFGIIEAILLSLQISNKESNPQLHTHWMMFVLNVWEECSYTCKNSLFPYNVICEVVNVLGKLPGTWISDWDFSWDQVVLYGILVWMRNMCGRICVRFKVAYPFPITTPFS